MMSAGEMVTVSMPASELMRAVSTVINCGFRRMEELPSVVYRAD
jgi:hypothetical protein